MKATAFFSAIGITVGLLACGPETNQQSAPPAPLTEAEQTAYLDQGKAIAGATFAALSARLQVAIQEGGVPNAISYCNLQAYPLVDSLSAVHQAQIRRTSLQERNPKNAPTAVEKPVLEAYASQAAAGDELGPLVVQLEDGNVAFYAPIKVNAFCLQCHGKIGETLSEENYAVIKENYPSDRATGYTDGDLRGMWSIQFRPNSK